MTENETIAAAAAAFDRRDALKAQMDIVRGSRDSLMTFRGSDDVVWDGRMRVLSVALDFAF